MTSAKNKLKFIMKKKWISSDAWRGYEQPVYAVAGVSATGMWSDSPAPSNIAKKEIEDIQKALRKAHIQTKIMGTQSSNVFMEKGWVVVPPQQYKKAKKLAEKWIKENEKTTQLIHGA